MLLNITAYLCAAILRIAIIPILVIIVLVATDQLDTVLQNLMSLPDIFAGVQAKLGALK